MSERDTRLICNHCGEFGELSRAEDVLGTWWFVSGKCAPNGKKLSVQCQTRKCSTAEEALSRWQLMWTTGETGGAA